MITHEGLVEQVASQAQLSDADRAARVVKVTLATVARRLDMPQRRRLRQAVPGPERDAVFVTVPPVTDGMGGLLREMGRYLDTSPERALYLARTVLSAVAEGDPQIEGELRSGLPAGLADLLPGPEQAPRAPEAESG